jgi:hypothetical protein
VPRSYLLVTDNRYDTAFLALIQAIQRIHIILAEAKVVDIDVADDPRWGVALGERYEAFL